MNWTFIHFILCAILLHHLSSSSPMALGQQPSTIFAEHQQRIIKNFHQKNLANLANALCLGNKKKVGTKTKEMLKNLGLLHLLTPSGLHLSSLLVLLLPLTRILRRKNAKMLYLVDLLIAISLYLFTSLYSARRVALLHPILRVGRNIKIPPYFLCLLTFVFDYFLGGYKASPLSYIFSFIFLGGILSLNQLNGRQALPLFFSGQILIAATLKQSVYPLLIFIGIVLCPLFTFLFPLIFLLYWIPLTHQLLEMLLSVFFSFIHKVALFSSHTPIIQTNHIIIYLIPFFWINGWRKLKRSALLLLIIFYPNSIYNLPLNRILSPQGGVISTKNISEVKLKKSGYEWRDRYQRRCQVKLYDDNYRELCD